MEYDDYEMNEEELEQARLRAAATWSDWTPLQGDVLSDMEKMINKIRYERWICKGCAWYTNAPPNANITLAILTCPDCGGTDFHYTYEPYE